MSNGEIEYMDICRMLKRYSFESKMRICSMYSRAVIDGSGTVVFEKMRGNVYPWELETFLLMSIKATPEYQNYNFEGTGYNIFIKMINAIRNYEHPSLEKWSGDIRFVDMFLPATGLNQFDLQQNQQFIMYRYYFIFTFVNEKVNMKDEFFKFFGASYDEFVELGSYLTLLYGAQLEFSNEIIDYLVNSNYSIVCKNLTITLDEYKSILDKLTTQEEDYVTCLRPSYRYPFIQRGITCFCLCHTFSFVQLLRPCCID